MMTVQVENFAQGPALVERVAPRPRPGRNELLVRVHAAGVTPSELRWYPTSHDRNGGERQSAIPAHEFSGVVVEIGEGVGGLECGRAVYGMNGWFADGALAEFCIAEFHAVAPKPDCLTHAEAASVPIGALTAWQGLFDRARMQPGERVLVHGGAGAVGVYAIQLAKLRGARVIATVSGRNAELAKELGADVVIDYARQPFEEAGPVDVVFDAVGGETFERSWSVLKPNGRMVTIVAEAEESKDPRVQAAFFIVEPNQKQLSEVAILFDERRLRPVLDSVVPLERAADAYAGRVERKGRGKIVIMVTE